MKTVVQMEKKNLDLEAQLIKITSKETLSKVRQTRILEK